MNTGENLTPAADDAGAASSLLSLEFDLAPAWARKPPEAHRQRYADDPRGGAASDRRSGGGRDSRRGHDDFRRERRPAPRGAHAPDPRREGGRPGPGPRNPFYADRRRPDERREFRPVREEPLPPLPLEVRALPDQKALGAIIRKIQSSHRAYPLRDIARLFLDNDNAYQIRIEPIKNETVPLFQCKVCGLPALSEEEIRTHVLATHLGDFFDVSEIETDPPSGNFACVARCGLSGELLGPPNHHSYTANVQEMLRTRFAHMSADAYRARIEMVRDPDVINQWKEACRKKKAYRRKRPAADIEAPAADAAPTPEPTADAAPVPAAAPAEEPLGPPLERAAADAIFQREILPEQILSARHLVCPANAMRRTPSARLLATVREAMNRELRFPASLFFALRGAFRHRSLHLFRAQNERGPEFAVAHAPTALDATHVVADLRQVLEHVNQNPGCTRQELLDALAGGDEARGAQLATQLNTLVEKAHVIEYYNGVLCAPMEHPVFHYLPGERDGRKTGEKKAESRIPKSESVAEPAPQPDPIPATPVIETASKPPAQPA